MTRIRNLLQRIPLFVALVGTGLVVVGVVAVVVFAGGDDEKVKLADPDPENHSFHINGVADRYAGPAPMTISFAAKPFHSVGKVHYFWRFDDGAASTEQVAKHNFKEPGYYQVLVDAQDEQGNLDRMNVFVGVWPKNVWTSAMAGKPYNQVKEVAHQWARTTARKKQIVANCLKVPACRKQELAERARKRKQQAAIRAACKKAPGCLAKTRKVYRASQERIRRAKRLGYPTAPTVPAP